MSQVWGLISRHQALKQWGNNSGQTTIDFAETEISTRRGSYPFNCVFNCVLSAIVFSCVCGGTCGRLGHWLSHLVRSDRR